MMDGLKAVPFKAHIQVLIGISGLSLPQTRGFQVDLQMVRDPSAVCAWPLASGDSQKPTKHRS